MDSQHLKQIEARLDQTINLLQEQTAQLKSDLKVIQQHISDLGSPSEGEEDDIWRKAKEYEERTEQQLLANQDFLKSVEQAKENTTEEDGPVVSDLEKRAIDMLKRMQEKADAKEFLSELYEGDIPATSIEETESPSASTARDNEHLKNEKVNIDTPPPSTDWKAVNDMEKKVDDFKKKDALDALKKKMKGN